MGVEHKLKEWEQRGLIDAAQRARIEAFEHERARPVLLYALGGLGAFTVGTGIVSIVAANWDELGKVPKLGFDLALAMGLSVALYWAASSGRKWQTDVIAGVYYAFTLASIALLGQIYQLGSPVHHALLAWSALTLPLMTLVNGRFLGLFWLTGLTTTHALTLIDWLERLEQAQHKPQAFVASVGIVAITLSWALYLGISHLPVFTRRRPMVSRAWSEALWLAWLVAGLLLCFVFYAQMSSEDVLSFGPLVALFCGFGLQALVPRVYAHLPELAQLGLRVGLVAVPSVLALASTYEREAVPAAGAILQVLLLCLAAFTVLRLGRVGAFNLLTGLISLRVLVMYFEVFGSMLDTGLGMITGGVLTLGLAYVWKRKSPELAARFATHPGAGEGESHAA